MTDTTVGNLLDALAVWRRKSDAVYGLIQRLRNDDLQHRVAEWVRTRIGRAHMAPAERAMRLLEEAMELAQAEGVNEAQVYAQMKHVFSRPAGEPLQEGAGVAVCLLAWCAARGVLFREVAEREVDRIEAKPIEQILGSLARKADAGLVTVVEG